ncbi:YicC/YloC family endoribonuclease [Planctomycetota bacterium]
MINSMTGYGQAEFSDGKHDIAVEIKTVNNKYLNLKINLPAFLNKHEPDMEKTVRAKVSRGSVQIFIKFRIRHDEPNMYFNTGVISGYLQDIDSLSGKLAKTKLETGGIKEVRLTDILALPGVLEELPRNIDNDEMHALLKPVLDQALDALTKMRAMEGKMLGEHLRSIHSTIGKTISRIDERAPLVMAVYRDKLLKRARQLLNGSDIQIEEADLHREIALFSDRADISEEIARLNAHMQQVASTLSVAGTKGRKLDFLAQEMLREANTIGSKANDLEVAQAVVELKTHIEQMKEQIQNIE